MERNAESILKDALELPDADRTDIAGALLESLEPAADADVEMSWRREVAIRVADLDAGEVGTIPWGDVRNRLLVRLREHSRR